MGGPFLTAYGREISIMYLAGLALTLGKQRLSGIFPQYTMLDEALRCSLKIVRGSV
jgi:hypothetical protein